MKTESVDAIMAHINWIVRFEAIVNGVSSESLDSQQVGDDTICDFGAWLQKSRDQFPSVECYEQIKQLHQNFHHKASEIVLQLQQEQRGSIPSNVADLNNISAKLIEALGSAMEGTN